MNSYIVDTHALFWHLIGSTKLSTRAREIFNQAGKGEAILVVPVIVLVELLAMYEKFKPPRQFLADLGMLSGADQFRLLPLEPNDLRSLVKLVGVSEMHDRLVVACAQALDIPCITCDKRITESKTIQVAW